MFDLIRKDFERAREINHRGSSPFALSVLPLFHVGSLAVFVHRFGAWSLRLKIPLIRELLLLIYFLARSPLSAFAGINIPLRANIGPGFVVHTWGGVFVPCCTIGKNVVFQHGVVVSYRCRGIGDNVYFGPGAKVIRDVRIGNNAKIGANCVVLHDVPDNATVAGIPAQIVSGPHFVDSDTSEDNCD